MWTVDYTTRIFVQELGSNKGQILPRLQPLDGGTIIQVFGYESDIYKLAAKVVGYADLNALKALVEDGAEHIISEVASGVSTSGYMYFRDSFYIKNISDKRLSTMKQTIRQDLDCYAPVFDVEMELYKDDS